MASCTSISTSKLALTPLFQQHTEALSVQERVRTSYRRAQAVAQHFALTPEDVMNLSPKFWQLHRDQIVLPMDGAVAVLLTIQYNLCAGTIAPHVAKQPAIQPIFKQIMNFEVSGQFMLTEVGHGLNARNIETTATMLPGGGFLLNTPHDLAAKYMPPTAPIGMVCVAVVFARLIDEAGQDRGIKSFIVHLNDGKSMMPGITCKLLPPRGGSRPVNHSLTYFKNVTLPDSALLGDKLRAADQHSEFFRSIHRVVVGGLTMAAVTLPSLRTSAYIAAKYSLRRHTVDAMGELKPIIAFQTQKIPVLTALAQAFVLEKFFDKSVSQFKDTKLDHRVRHAISSITKTVVLSHTQDANQSLADRCGAQGLFEVNQITGTFSDIRGLAIAEGDLLVVSIRLATELLLNRYAIPAAKNPDSLLAQHESILFAELQTQLRSMPSHRSAEFDKYNLAQSVPLVTAIGHRMAYEAAVEANVHPALIDLYVVSCMKTDPALYVEKMSISRRQMVEMEVKAIDAVFENMKTFMKQMQIEPYITAPIVSDETWKAYVHQLQTFESVQAMPDSDVEVEVSRSPRTFERSALMQAAKL